MIACCGGAYGAAMASYHCLARGDFSADVLQMVTYGALKVPMLFLATLVLAVPFFYVVNLLAGVGDDFAVVRRALFDYQITVALQLGALTPVTLLVNVSITRYEVAQLWSTLMFGIAAWGARRSLLLAYEPLEVMHGVHRLLRRVWFVLYAFVGVQMAWTLRPFIGNPDLPAQFFRDRIGNGFCGWRRHDHLFRTG